MVRGGKTLSGGQRRALDSVCRRVVPAAYEPGFESELTAEVEARISTLDPSLARQMAGALTIFDHPVTGVLMMFSAHVNGTCRIGTDPRTSGATPDGSLLPTGLGANPQETIVAISSIISERIAETHSAR